MAGVLVRSDKESQIQIPKDYVRRITKCHECDTHYQLAHSADEAKLEARATGTFNTRDQLMHDAGIAVTKEHPAHATELFIWGFEKQWQPIEIVRD
jgi:hypothetical protein